MAIFWIKESGFLVGGSWNRTVVLLVFPYVRLVNVVCGGEPITFQGQIHSGIMMEITVSVFLWYSYTVAFIPLLY